MNSKQEYCSICNAVLDENGYTDQCAGTSECERQLVSELDPTKELNFDSDPLSTWDDYYEGHDQNDE